MTQADENKKDFLCFLAFVGICICLLSLLVEHNHGNPTNQESYIMASFLLYLSGLLELPLIGWTIGRCFRKLVG